MPPKKRPPALALNNEVITKYFINLAKENNKETPVNTIETIVIPTNVVENAEGAISATSELTNTVSIILFIN